MDGLESSSSRQPFVGVQNNLNMVIKFIVFLLFCKDLINAAQYCLINIIENCFLLRMNAGFVPQTYSISQLFDLDQALW